MPAFPDSQRGTGRTTMAALNYVQLILDNPGKWIEIEDHGPIIQADRYLFDLVCSVLRALRINFEAGKNPFRVVC